MTRKIRQKNEEELTTPYLLAHLLFLGDSLSLPCCDVVGSHSENLAEWEALRIRNLKSCSSIVRLLCSYNI